MTDEQRAELEQKYLLALLTRDAREWHRRVGRVVQMTHDDIEEPKPKRQPKTFLSETPCSKCGSHRRYAGSGWKCVRCADEKAKRADRIKAEALGRTTPPSPRGRGLGIRPSQLLGERALQKRAYLATLARAAKAPVVKSEGRRRVARPPHNAPSAATIEARAAAIKADLKTYRRAEPCVQCGGSEFFTRYRGPCVVCHRRHVQESKKRPVPAAPVMTMAEPRRLRPSQLIRPGAPVPSSTKALKYAPHEKPRRWGAR